jgi:hypothetical protein
MGLFDKISNMLKPATRKLSSIFNPTNANKINKSKKALARAENTKNRLTRQSANLAALKPRLNNATQKYEQYDCAKYKSIIDEGKEKLGNASVYNKLKALPTLGIKNIFGKVNRSEILSKKLRNANARVAAARTAKMNTAVKLAETRVQQSKRARELAVEANAKAAAAAKILENVKAETPTASAAGSPMGLPSGAQQGGAVRTIGTAELRKFINSSSAAHDFTIPSVQSTADFAALQKSLSSSPLLRRAAAVAAERAAAAAAAPVPQEPSKAEAKAEALAKARAVRNRALEYARSVEQRKPALERGVRPSAAGIRARMRARGTPPKESAGEALLREVYAAPNAVPMPRGLPPQAVFAPREPPKPRYARVNQLFPSGPQQVPQNGRRLGPLVRARVNALERLQPLPPPEEIMETAFPPSVDDVKTALPPSLDDVDAARALLRSIYNPGQSGLPSSIIYKGNEPSNIDSTTPQAPSPFDVEAARWRLLYSTTDNPGNPTPQAPSPFDVEAARWRLLHSTMDNPGNPTPLQRQNMILPQLTMDRAIFIKTERGDSFFVDAKPSDNIGDLKDKIKEKRGIAKGDQHLVYQGKNLNNNAPVYNIKDGDSPVLVVKGASASDPEPREISNNEKKYGLRPTRLPTRRTIVNKRRSSRRSRRV